MGQIEHAKILETLSSGGMNFRDDETIALANKLTPEELTDISLRGYIYSYEEGGHITEIQKVR